MFPEYVQFGYEILDRGEVTFTNFNDSRTEEVTETISTPEDSAHYTLRARGLRPVDPISIDLTLKTALAFEIGRRQAKAQRRRQAFLELLQRAA